MASAQEIQHVYDGKLAEHQLATRREIAEMLRRVLRDFRQMRVAHLSRPGYVEYGDSPLIREAEQLLERARDLPLE